MRDFDLWRRWLAVVCWTLAMFGVGLALFNQAPLFDRLFNDRANPSFWPGGRIPPEARLFQRWIYGVLGAVLAGWAVLRALVVEHAFPLKAWWAWRAVALGVGVWFVLDSALSLYFGVASNALVNLVPLVAVGLPLAATARRFDGADGDSGRPGTTPRRGM